jgi:hypothetical protein
MSSKQEDLEPDTTLGRRVSHTHRWRGQQIAPCAKRNELRETTSGRFWNQEANEGASPWQRTSVNSF